MPFQKIPEGFVHPGYVLVSLYTGKGEPVVNVYGPYPSLAVAKRVRKQDLARFEEEHGAVKARDLSIFARPIHDLDQLNRLTNGEKPEVPETRVEYRALIRSPWNILDPKELREQGYTESWSGYHEDPKDIIKIANYRSEEERRWIAKWEKRTVIVGPWEEDTNAHS